jgi:hypothetical protein
MEVMVVMACNWGMRCATPGGPGVCVQANSFTPGGRENMNKKSLLRASVLRF